MKYSDLIEFDPIEEIVQLRDARSEDRAKVLVKTYVISDDMAHRLSEVLLPNLRIDLGGQAKGMLTVGNYGSGKSHLMSVVSAIAERADLLELVENRKVRDAAKAIAGKFKVVRMEIGSTEMPLRQIITGNIEKSLADWNISYRFPAASKIAENKTSFEDMMVAFHEKFPDHGLLVVVDELLDYLRSRPDQPLILDLGFLREVGEVCKDLNFRFIAGVQEAIFESGRFSHVAESVSRVKDRFDQIRIATTDVSFVVAHRLLKKTHAQKEKVRKYLEGFSKFYEGWTQRMDEFVNLFPVHPDYIETFERIPIVEKRGVLQVLSRAFGKMLNETVPEEMPGILAADSFWPYLLENPSFRAIPEVKATMECSRILEDKVKSGFPKNRRQYQPMALRIIHGLSVNRLTTTNLHATIGMTPEELRDRLCLYHSFAATIGGNDPAEDLLGLVEITLKEIRNTVSGQFLSQNADNRQYFLDLQKTEDYDALIEKKTETLDKHVLDRGYFTALQELLECTDPTSFTGSKIWERSIIWTERNVTKLGWLFFGVPSERSTAQPPRDFYLYFIQPFAAPGYTDAKQADEVFFKLETSDPLFEQTLKLYAASAELESTATGVKKQEYAHKKEQHLRTLTRWLREHFLSAIFVTHEGKSKALSQALAGANAAGLTTREQVFGAASRFLTPHFASVCGEYPRFSKLITFGSKGNAEQAVQDALRTLQGTPTQLGTSVLDALGLLNVDKVDPYSSVYAKYVLELLNQKGHGQVLNRSELIQEIDGIPYFVAPGKFRLEIELLIAVLGALIHSGDLVLSVPGKDFSATDLAALAARPIRELLDFKHLKKPKDWNLPAIRAVFELLGLPPGLAVKVTQNDTEAVILLATEVEKRVQRLVLARQEFSNGVPFWGYRLLADDEVAAFAKQIDGAKEFLESLQAYNSPGKFKNLRYSVDEVKAQETALRSLKQIEELKSFADALAEYTTYLSQAESVLPDGHPWRAKCQETKKELRESALKPENRASSEFRQEAIKRLEGLKKDYVSVYLGLYQHSRLNHGQDKKKAELLGDYRSVHLRALASISTINRSQLVEIQDEFGRLKTGESLTASDLEANPVAGEFYPAMEKADGPSAEQRLKHIESQIQKVYAAWTQALLDELDDPVTEANLGLLKTADRKLVDEFRSSKALPEPMPARFVPSIQQALAGLTRVPVRVAALHDALFPNGNPTTLDEVKERFSAYLEQLLKGQDRTKVRLVLEKDNP